MKKTHYLLIGLFIFSSISIFSIGVAKGVEKPTSDKDGFTPWYTGPLIAESATNVAPGNVEIQPYLFIRNNPSNYSNNWNKESIDNAISYRFLTLIETGITDWLSILCLFRTIPYVSNSNKNASEFGDTTILLGFQALKEDANTNKPNVRIGLLR
jgi:hypothetical protein